MTDNSSTTTPERRRLSDILGTSWAFRDGMVRLTLQSECGNDEFAIWMSPGQVLEMIEQGARAARLALKGSL